MFFEVFTQNLDLKSNESEYSDLSDPDGPYYEPGQVDTDFWINFFFIHSSMI